MTTSTFANTVAITDQRGSGATKAFRVEISDPYTRISGLGYGDSEQEAFNFAFVSFQDNAECQVKMALREAKEAFSRIRTLS